MRARPATAAWPRLVHRDLRPDRRHYSGDECGCPATSRGASAAMASAGCVRMKRLVGALHAGAAGGADLIEVRVGVRDAPSDPSTQVAESQRRHGLTPQDLACFIRARVGAGESNSSIAKRMGMNLTSVAHHLALLELPPELDGALRTGRCTSPRTLRKLSKLRQDQPVRSRRCWPVVRRPPARRSRRCAPTLLRACRSALDGRRPTS